MKELVVLLSVVINVIILFVLHYKQHSGSFSVAYEREKAVKLSRKLIWELIKKKQLSQCIPTSKNIIKYSQNRVNRYGANYITFAVFLCFNYILPYFMWTSGEVYCCNILTTIRFLGTTMCIPLLLKNYWPIRTRKYFPTYWHTTVMYVLPFSTTFSFLIVGGTTEWLINIALAIIMLCAVVDWLTCIMLAGLGTGLGITLYHLFFAVLTDMPPLGLDLMTKHQLTYTCIFATSIGLLFFGRREKVVDKRLETLELFGKVVGAEIRKILALSKAYASSIEFFNKQMHVDKVLPAEDNRELYLIKMDKIVYSSLKETTNGLTHDSERGIQTINRMLANLQKHISTDDFTTLSMQTCVTNSLTLYGLTAKQKGSLLINLDKDFQFYGSAYYMQHILFNLLENTYKHNQKDCIVEIWLANNKLHVKDNGTGIAKEALPYIFDPFFTTVKKAMGIGLAFCKLVMEAFGGIIICKSKQGRYSFTEFVLTFPEVNKKARKDSAHVVKAYKQ
jgi:Histidine kinase-, DNA gyrase B-, and HSP90-like ATPase